MIIVCRLTNLEVSDANRYYVMMILLSVGRMATASPSNLCSEHLVLSASAPRVRGDMKRVSVTRICVIALDDRGPHLMLRSGSPLPSPG